MQFDRKSNRTWLITVGALYALLLACGGATPPIAGTPSDAAAAAPSIATQPSNQTVALGKTATFSLTATGAAPLSYQWEKSGVDILGATAATYTTPVTTLADNGSTYIVVVSNSVGAQTSNPATLTVTTTVIAPTITTQPSNKSVRVGQTATFSVTAAGTLPFTYQWKKGGTAIAGATASTYTTPATAIGDNGSTFLVVVSNAAGSQASNSATLTVTAAASAPTITQQPSNQTVNVGQTATFSVTATGSAPLSYQWKKAARRSPVPPPPLTRRRRRRAPTTPASTFLVVVSNSVSIQTSNRRSLG